MTIRFTVNIAETLIFFVFQGKNKTLGKKNKVGEKNRVGEKNVSVFSKKNGDVAFF